MWTAKNRRQYDRGKLRYPCDLTDDEWAYVGPLIPPAKRGGNKRRVDVREVMNGRSKLCKQRLRRVMYIEHGMPVAMLFCKRFSTRRRCRCRSAASIRMAMMQATLR